MENTGKVLFQDDTPQWYIAQGEQWTGPLTAADVYQKVLDQEIGWADFVWKPGQAGWERICDLKTFQAAVPQLPGKSIQKEVKEAAKPAVKPAAKQSAGKRPAAPVKTPALPKGSTVEEKIWFLYFNESQFGPFAKSEVTRYLQTGKINGRVYAWMEGMENWVRLEALDGFKEAVASSKKSAARGERRDVPRLEHRNAPRRPLVAKVILANDNTIATAVCRDISVGGMQALTDKIPGPVGTRVKMNVSVTGESGKIEPFVAEGVIVRILDDGRGFSFRFEKLPENAKRTIESYINTAG